MGGYPFPEDRGRPSIEHYFEEAKEKKQTQIDENIRQLQEYDQQTRVGLGQQRDKMVRDILKEIETVIEKYAKDRGYTMVLNNRVLLYGQKQDDDLLRSCTLGKATENVDWDSVTETIEFNGQTFKIYLIAVVYKSG